MITFPSCLRQLALAATLFAAACSTPLEGRWTNVERIVDARPGQVLLEFRPSGDATVDLADGLTFGFFAEIEEFRYRVEGNRLRALGEGFGVPKAGVPFSLQGDMLTFWPAVEGELRSVGQPLRWRRVEVSFTLDPGE